MPVDFGDPADGARAIQLALAPVFLLTGIAGILNVLASRLARIIDRARRLTENPGPIPRDTIVYEIGTLERRRHLASVAITSCTLSALLVCLVIVLLFLEALLAIPLKWLEGVVFTGSTLALVVGLTYFLREINVATQNVRFEILQDAPSPPEAGRR